MILPRVKVLQSAITLLLTISVLGCAPGLPVRPKVAPPPRPVPEASDYRTPIDPVDVERRIQRLETILAEKELLDEDRRLEATALLGDYLNILRELRAPGAVPGDTSVAAILFERLGSIESGFFEPERDPAPPPAPMVSLTATKEKRIRDAYDSGDYRAVIQACMDHESAYGPESLSPGTELLFAMALAESGRAREAIKVGERVLSALDGRPDLLQLRSSMVVWYQEQGNLLRAKDHYEKLLDEMRERRAFLDLAERRMEPSLAHTFPQRLPEPPPEITAERVEISGPLADTLNRVETLMESKSFDQARLLLVRQRIRYPEGKETAAIDRAMDRIDRVEAGAYRPTTEPYVQPMPDETLDQALDQAREFIDAEDYEKALSRLDELRGFPDEKDPRVSTLRKRAETELVRSGREKAARLFLTARNTQNPKEKENHLRASHGLLSDLLERFPESSMAPTIRSNLLRVEEEMERAGLPRTGWQRRE